MSIELEEDFCTFVESEEEQIEVEEEQFCTFVEPQTEEEQFCTFVEDQEEQEEQEEHGGGPDEDQFRTFVETQDEDEYGQIDTGRQVQRKRPDSKTARTGTGEPNRTIRLNELIAESTLKLCSKATGDVTHAVCHHNGGRCREKLMETFTADDSSMGTFKSFEQAVIALRQKRLNCGDWEERNQMLLEYLRHGTYSKSSRVVDTVCIFGVDVCVVALSWMIGATDHNLLKARACLRDKNAYELERSSSAQKKRRLSAPKGDDVIGWLQANIALLACEPPKMSVNKHLVLNMTIYDLHRLYKIDRDRMGITEETLCGSSHFAKLFRDHHGKGYEKFGNRYVHLGKETGVHSAAGCKICNELERQKTSHALYTRQQAKTTLEQHWVQVRAERNNYVLHIEWARAWWQWCYELLKHTTNNTPVQPRPPNSVLSLSCDATGCFFTRMPITPKGVASLGSRLESKISIGIVHGAENHKDHCIRAVSCAWVHSNTNLQITIFVHVLLNKAVQEWKKTNATPPDTLVWQCDRGADMSNSV